MLWLYQRLVLGPVTPYVSALPDLTRREMVTVIPLVIIVFVIGLYPGAFLNLMQASVTTLVQHYSQIQSLSIVAVFTAP